MVDRTPPRGQADQGAVDHPGRLSRLPRRGLVLEGIRGPRQSHPGGRTLLRFWQVDYKADVWLNDTAVGSHEGGESPFVFDVTDIVKPGQTNRLAVRVLNPTHQPIDGIVLNETPHRNKALPYGSGSAWNQGGIWDSVEVLPCRQPGSRISSSGRTGRRARSACRSNLRNAGAGAVEARVQSPSLRPHGRDAGDHQSGLRAEGGRHAHRDHAQGGPTSPVEPRRSRFSIA